MGADLARPGLAPAKVDQRVGGGRAVATTAAQMRPGRQAAETFHQHLQLARARSLLSNLDPIIDRLQLATSCSQSSPAGALSTRVAREGLILPGRTASRARVDSMPIALSAPPAAWSGTTNPAQIPQKKASHSAAPEEAERVIAQLSDDLAE